MLMGDAGRHFNPQIAEAFEAVRKRIEVASARCNGPANVNFM